MLSPRICVQSLSSSQSIWYRPLSYSYTEFKSELLRVFSNGYTFVDYENIFISAMINEYEVSPLLWDLYKHAQNNNWDAEIFNLVNKRFDVGDWFGSCLGDVANEIRDMQVYSITEFELCLLYVYMSTGVSDPTQQESVLNITGRDRRDLIDGLEILLQNREETQYFRIHCLEDIHSPHRQFAGHLNLLEDCYLCNFSIDQLTNILNFK